MFLLLPIAFISGILTVFSPCVLPILPAVLASGIDGNTTRIKGVITGLVISFTAASLLLATIVRAVGIPADTVRLLAVGLLLLFGLSLALPDIWDMAQAMIEKYWRFQPRQSDNRGFTGGLITGVSLGIVWTPCIGPVVAAVATLSAVSAFTATGVLISLSYALGTGLPLYFIAKKGSQATAKLAIFKNESLKIRQVFGLIILLTALFIWSGADRQLQAWTLRTLPESWTQLATTFESQVTDTEQLDKLRQAPQQPTTTTPSTLSEKEIVKQVSLQDDFTGAKVAKQDLLQGCFRQDCIPSIDQPVFESAQLADEWLEPTDRVFAINYQGVVRAYPQRILNWHEIVNDSVNDTPVAITFCPLCGSAVAFERRVDGVITQLGVSGKLHNSDLVMYDRYEGNLWQQITGEAIVGPAARRDEMLKQIPVITVEWQQWKEQHPATQVLSRNTGFDRNYDQYPYGTYEEDDQLLFGVAGLNNSLPIKTPVYGVKLDNYAKAYPTSLFENSPRISDTLGPWTIELLQQPSGELLVTNTKTGEEIVPIRLFWFAWAAFHPDTQLYQITN